MARVKDTRPCRKAATRVLQIVPAIVRRLRPPMGISGGGSPPIQLACARALDAARGARAAQTNPASSRATAVTAFCGGTPRIISRG